MITQIAYITGKVQGVGFRYQTKIYALSLNLYGYAKNLDDGAVEVKVTGESHNIEALFEWIKQNGPNYAKVQSILIEPSGLVLFKDFAVL